MSIANQKNQEHGERYKAVLSNRIYLKRTKQLHDDLLETLTYVLPSRKFGMPDETFCDVTRINDNVLSIPIGTAHLLPNNYIVEDKRILNPTTFPKFKYELREDQQEILDKVEDSCLIKANPSWGKTFCGVCIATKLKQKTLIVVHTAKLRNQWRKEIKKTLGIDAGEIGGGKNISNKPIVVATIQSLRNRMSQIRSEYGLVILDEVHHLPATVFKGIIDDCRARYKIGLTATNWRKDGRHVFINDYLGKDTFIAKDNNKLKSEIFVIDSNIEFSSNANIPWGRRINDLVNNPDFIELVLNLSKIQADRGHKVLTVSDRVEFLEFLGDLYPDFQVIAGGSAKDEVDIINNTGIFGSIKIFSEGVNIPELSSLIPAVPINNRALLEQLLGRIERIAPNKMKPEAFDIRLKGKTARYQFSQRVNFYMDNGYKIHYL